MTYIKYPNVRMYWSSLPGMRMDLIANNMTVNRFSEIKRFLHFENNESKPNSNDPSSDKYWKLRPILSMLHDSFHAAATPEENVAIDEMMVPFKGRSSQKQYLKSKPKKWGFKVWVMANSDGYVNCFELYQGASNTSIKSNYGPIGDTVIRLCHDLIGKNHKLFLDNLFTSLPLLRHLKDQHILVLGTLRLNRVPGIMEHLLDGKYLQRGWTSLATSDDNITVLRWQDNKLVHTISTYAGAIPEDKAKRFDRKSRTTIEITRPYVISEYNRFMGGVDIMDRMIAHYPHGFKNRKWYLRIFFHFLNISIINSWILFKKSIDPNLPLVQFKASLVWTLLQLGKETPRRGRKSDSLTQQPPKKKPTRVMSTPAEIRYDNNNHYPLKTYAKNANRCHEERCHSKTRYICQKCEVPLCPECMCNYHTKNK